MLKGLKNLFVPSTVDVFQRSRDFKGVKEVHLSVPDAYQLVLLDTSVCKQIVKLFKKEQSDCQLSYGKILKRKVKEFSVVTRVWVFCSSTVC